ncbi:MAG TPA: hypothetical protein VG650_08785 [Mycobacteriales bacterium]|nr:hypothetical protein [Mycobacteriales bacterium]
MVIAREFHGPGWTGEQYDKLIELMGFGGHSAPGVLFHWAAVTDDGVLAVDVYESADAADELVLEKIGPLAGELGLASPDVKQYEVRGYLTPA